jgi:triosephosphate isomerase
MRRPIIAGNWKMFKTIAETREFCDALIPAILGVDYCEIVVAPPFTALAAASEEVDGTRISIASQDVFWEAQGAFTGQIAVRMLVDAGCTFSIIGHSERRQFFGETDETVAKKTRAAIDGGLFAIVCVGESLAERDAGQAVDVVRRQVQEGLGKFSAQDLSFITIAYEPVWAIGTGRTATPETAEEMHAEIRRTISEIHGEAAAAVIRILYGGSVKPDNIGLLMAKENIDGALVGGASLDAASFASIIKYMH